jgi:hypothetical protein
MESTFRHRGEIQMQDEKSKSAAKSRLDELQAKDEELINQLFELKLQRQEARKSLFADFGCECDSNACRTEKTNEPISAGETDSYCHDDQDFGSLSIHCISGDIEVVISRAVWSTFDEYDRKRLSAGQNWNRKIDEASSSYDQTNRVEVIGHANSTYNLDFKSWDA